MTTSIQVQANLPGLLRSMRTAFADTSSVLTELLQNARRAGASRVDITTDETGVTVRDDGAGVDQFGALIQLATSGWDQSVTDSDAPFGVGFFACFYVSDTVSVRSTGGSVHFDSQRVLNAESFEIDREDAIASGTEVRLFGADVADQAMRDINKACRGLDLTVTMNGETVDNPHAASRLRAEGWTGIGFEFGTVWLDLRRPAASIAGQLYLQGVGIKDARSDARRIVHLSPNIQLSGFPDRTRLYGGEESKRQIIRVADQAVDDYVVELLGYCDPEDFATLDTLLQACRGKDAKSAFNDYGFVPSDSLYVPEDESDYSLVRTHCIWRRDGLITKSEMDAGEVRVVDFQDCDAGINERLYALAGEALVLAKTLPKGHWLYRHPGFMRVIDDNPAVSVKAKASTDSAQLMGWHRCCAVSGALMLAGPWGEFESPVSVADQGDAILIGKGVSAKAGLAAWFMPDVDEYDDSHRNEWAKSLARAEAQLYGDDSGVQGVLESLDAEQLAVLRDFGPFEVSFSDGGRPIVTAA